MDCHKQNFGLVVLGTTVSVEPKLSYFGAIVYHEMNAQNQRWDTLYTFSHFNDDDNNDDVSRTMDRL